MQDMCVADLEITSFGSIHDLHSIPSHITAGSLHNILKSSDLGSTYPSFLLYFSKRLLEHC